MAEHATDPDLPPVGWTEEAVHVHRIGVEPHSISVGTARDDMVESRIAVHASAPITESTAEHIVEADLDASTGQIAVSRAGILQEDERSMAVPSGLLRVRVSYIPSEPPAVDSNSGPGDHFLYQIDLCPTDQARKLAGLKQGPNAWTG